jgi:hypothetical protein
VVVVYSRVVVIVVVVVMDASFAMVMIVDSYSYLLSILVSIFTVQKKFLIF